jgi:predicted Zn-dependent peptidase
VAVVSHDLPVTRVLGRGVRLHVLSTDRFTTSVCRVVWHADLGPDTTATAVLAGVLRTATAKHPTREALARRLDDLYGASLTLSSEKLGDRLLFASTLEWPTGLLPGAEGLLPEGLGLLREVLTEPKRGADGALDAEIVATERVNQGRAIAALEDDKGRYAFRRATQLACAGEPYARDPEGRREDLDEVTPTSLAALHGRLLATAPMDVFVVGDLSPREAELAVRRNLLWEGRAGKPAALAPAASVAAARARPRRVVERQALSQGKVVLVLRAALEPGSPLNAAAHTLAGVLGGGPYARLFKVVRETHGLCYYASAGWNEAKGLLVVQLGVDAKNEARARKLVLELFREVAGGTLEASALEGYREAVAHRVASLADSRGGMIGWTQQALALGLDPSPARYLARVRRVTPSEVRAVGRRLALDTVFALGEFGAGRKA